MPTLVKCFVIWQKKNAKFFLNVNKKKYPDFRVDF